MAAQTTIRIGIDVDDVLLDTARKVTELYNKKYGTSLTPDNWYDFEPITPWGVDDFRVVYDRVFELMMSDDYLSVGPVKGAQDALADFTASGYELFAITSRSSKMEDATLAQLEVLYPGLFSRDTVFHTDHYEHEDNRRAKREIVEEVQATHFVDDQIAHAREVVLTGAVTMLFCADYHWTKGVSAEGVIRIDGWEEAREIINGDKTSE